MTKILHRDLFHRGDIRNYMYANLDQKNLILIPALSISYIFFFYNDDHYFTKDDIC